MPPTYDYRCARCDDGLTVVKPMSAANEPEPCPVCKRPMDKLVPLTNFRVQGATPSFHRPR